MIAGPQTSSYRATRANEKKTDDNNDDNNSNIVSTLTQHAHSPNKRACKDDYRTCIQALEFGDGRSDWKEDEDWSLDDAAEGHYKHKLQKYSYYTYYVLSLCDNSNYDYNYDYTNDIDNANNHECVFIHAVVI